MSARIIDPVTHRYLRNPRSEKSTDVAGADDWRNRAACLGEDPELFFPIGKAGPSVVQVESARAVCSRCPVQEACLRWALRSGVEFGVWGGTSEEQRRAMARAERSGSRRFLGQRARNIA